MTFRPVVAVTADTDAVFETSVGVVHRIDERTRFVVYAERGSPEPADGDVAALVTGNSHATVDLNAERFAGVFDAVEERRYGRTETEYREWAVDRLRAHHTTTISYTGGNNVTYTKRCEPTRSDISIRSIEPVYLPDVRHTTDLGAYTTPTSTTRRDPRGSLSRTGSTAASTAERARPGRPTPTVRTAGRSPAGSTSGPNG